MRVLGVNAVFHDPASALVVDGEVVAAAEEERFNRRKHGKSNFAFSAWEIPELSARWCLEHAPGAWPFAGVEEALVAKPCGRASGTVGDRMARVVHVEIPVADAERARTFYQSVFGWEIAAGVGGYWLASTGPDEEPGIHGALIDRSELHAAPVVVIGVESLDDAVATAEGAGAVVLLTKQTIPSVGYSAYLRDSEGNVIGLFESDGDAG